MPDRYAILLSRPLLIQKQEREKEGRESSWWIDAHRTRYPHAFSPSLLLFSLSLFSSPFLPLLSSPLLSSPHIYTGFQRDTRYTANLLRLAPASVRRRDQPLVLFVSHVLFLARIGCWLRHLCQASICPSIQSG